MAEPDTTKQKKDEAADDEIANRAHIVTPDPEEDPGHPKLGVVDREDAKVDASPKKRTSDNGPLSVGVNFDASEK